MTDTTSIEPEGRYRIGGERELAWAIRKIGRARDMVGRADQHRKDAVEWAKAQKRPLERDEAFFEGLAVEFVEKQVCAQFPPGMNPAEDGERWSSKSTQKRWATPWGYVQARRAEASIVVDDPDLWIGWQTDRAESGMVRAAVEAARMLRDSGWSVTFGSPTAPAFDDPTFGHDPLGNIFTVDDGEIVPGLRWNPASVSYSVTVTSKTEFPAYDPAPDGSPLPESAPFTEDNL